MAAVASRTRRSARLGAEPPTQQTQRVTRSRSSPPVTSQAAPAPAATRSRKGASTKRASARADRATTRKEGRQAELEPAKEVGEQDDEDAAADQLSDHVVRPQRRRASQSPLKKVGSGARRSQFTADSAAAAVEPAAEPDEGDEGSGNEHGSDDSSDILSRASTWDDPVNPPREGPIFARSTGDPLRIWVHPSCHDSEQIKEDIIENGGECPDDDRHVHFWLLDARNGKAYDEAFERRTALGIRALDHNWVDDCVRKGARLSARTHTAKPRWDWKKRKSNRQPRTGFDDEDRKMLVRHMRAFIRECRRQNEHPFLRGNHVFELLERTHPHHPWHTWRNAYNKNVKAYNEYILGERKLTDLSGLRSSSARRAALHVVSSDKEVDGAEDGGSSEELPDWAQDGDDFRMPSPLTFDDTAKRAKAALAKPQPAVDPPGASSGGRSQQGAHQALADEVDGAMSAADAADLVYCCQDMRLARAFAHFIFPLNGDARDFAALVDDFLHANAGVWTPREDMLAMGTLGTPDERAALAAQKPNGNAAMASRVSFLRQQGVEGIGRPRFPFA